MTRIALKLAATASRLVRTARAVKQVWMAGGVCQVKVAPIHHGDILKGKRILITGGSAGIGLAIAEKCLSEGASVVITGRDKEKLANAVERLATQRVTPLAWDIAETRQHEAMLAATEKALGGPLDVLVNNAGVLGGYRDLLNLTEETWDCIQSTNSKGMVFLTKHVVNRWLAEKHTAKILNISSMRGSLGVRDGPYGMSKWALNGLTEGLGMRLAPHGILVNGIAPGIIATDSISIAHSDPRENAYLKGVPVERIGLPEEIAELAVFLLSDAANYIVGQTILCDGGYTLKI